MEFAVLLRRSIFDEVDCDASWPKKLKVCGFSYEDIKAVWDVVNDREWIDDLCQCDDKRKFAICLVNKVYVNTWFSHNYVSNVVPTSLGCMAGTPPAHIIYAMTCSIVLCKFNDALDSHGLISALSSHRGPQVPMFDVVHCDNTAVLVVVDATNLFEKLLVLLG